MYQLTNTTSILQSDGSMIPADMGNGDYIQYLAWVAAGNMPTPYTPPAVDWRPAMYDQLDAMRTPVYNALAGYGFTALATGDTATASAIAQVQIGLRGLKTLPAVVAATNEADLKAALMAGFRDVVSKAPPSVLSAFVGASL